jgi:hypothetical protein
MPASTQKPATLAQALVAFHRDPPDVHLDSVNPHFRSRFASLPGNLPAIREKLAKQGLSVSQFVTCAGTAENPLPALRTVILHESGEREEDIMLLSVEKPGPQAQGAAITYARRFALFAALGLVGGEDDDGEAAEQKPPFQAPASVRGNGKPDEEAVGLAAELIDLAAELGRLTGQEDVVANVQTAIEKHAIDKPWLRRAITAARKNIQTAGTQT